MKFIQFMVLAGIVAFSNTVLAHHSDVGLDEELVVALEGKVTNFRWRQPHVYLTLDVMENGEAVSWGIQLVSVNILARRGWSADSLVSGDEVFLRVHPATNGRKYGKLIFIERADGTPVAIDPEVVANSNAKTDSLNGNWTAINPGSDSPPPPRPAGESASAAAEETSPACTSGFDCFFRTNLVLNDAAKAAVEAYDPLSADNPEATCVGRPTPAALMSAKGYLLQLDLSEAEEKIFIRSEWFSEERTVWMDGRAHPEPSETLATGHSIGHWEDDTLVVDTQNFDNHRSPYQIGVPSGSQKHVVERYLLSADGRSMEVEYTLEDPEFLAEPLTHRNKLYFAPHMKMLSSSCDIENTRRFLN